MQKICLDDKDNLIKFVSRFAFLFCFAYMLYGCSIYGVYDDKRLIDTQANDKLMASAIKTKLLQADFGSAFSVSVYCFYDNVFLVGEAPYNIRAQAIEIARSEKPKTITPHWFAKKTDNRSDLMLAAEIRASLISTKGLSSTRIEAEVNNGRVVLLGVVHDDYEKQLAIHTVKSIQGVDSITSYLLLPPVK